jgi:hypothetical protein
LKLIHTLVTDLVLRETQVLAQAQDQHETNDLQMTQNNAVEIFFNFGFLPMRSLILFAFATSINFSS